MKMKLNITPNLNTLMALCGQDFSSANSSSIVVLAATIEKDIKYYNSNSDFVNAQSGRDNYSNTYYSISEEVTG